MSARIRGHYRIDNTGRVEPVADVNGSLATWACKFPPNRDKAEEQRFRIKRICVVGAALICICLGLMASLPQIQNAIVAHESARMASIRKTFVKSHPGFHTRGAHRWNQVMSDADRLE